MAQAYALNIGDAYGYLVAYRYPAMSRVIQAAGRLIRSSQDRGVLCLVDPRFQNPLFRCFFPDNWCSSNVNSLELPLEVKRFWDEPDLMRIGNAG